RAGCGAQAHHGSDGKRRRQFQTDAARGAIEDCSARQLAWVLRVADCHFRWVASTAKLTSPFPCRTFEKGIGRGPASYARSRLLTPRQRNRVRLTAAADNQSTKNERERGRTKPDCRDRGKSPAQKIEVREHHQGFHTRVTPTSSLHLKD